MSMKTSKLTIDLPFEEPIRKKPNKVTEKAMRQAETAKGVKKFNNLNDLLKDLRI